MGVSPSGAITSRSLPDIVSVPAVVAAAVAIKWRRCAVSAGFAKVSYHNLTAGVVALHKGFKV